MLVLLRRWVPVDGCAWFKMVQVRRFASVYGLWFFESRLGSIVYVLSGMVCWYFWLGLLFVQALVFLMQVCASASLCFFSLWTALFDCISACFIVNKNEVLGGKIWWVWTNVMIWFMAFWYRFWCVLFDAISGLICWSYNRAAEIMWLFFLALLVQVLEQP